VIVRVSVNFDRGRFDQQVERAVNAGISRAAFEGKQFMSRGLGKGKGDYAASAAGSPPNVQRGQLRSSITSTEAVNFRASAGTPLKYGLIQERGGVIRPKKGKFLPVPLNIPAKRIMEREGTPKNTKTQLIRTKNGKLLLWGEDKQKVKNRAGRKVIADQVPIWILVKQVKFPPRPWCLPAVERNRDAIANSAIKRAAQVFRQGVGA